MINNKFEAYKIKREIKRSGSEYEFKRKEKNEFGELTDNEVIVGKLKGLYHEQSQTISVMTGDSTQYRTKKVPMILCLYDEAAFLNIGDLLTISKKTFKVTGLANISEWNIVADISMEEIDYGRWTEN